MLLVALSPTQRAVGPAEAIRLNNLGVGYMNQARIAEALQMFRRAATTDPSLFAARLNEGIALLNNQQLAEARDILLDATRRQPQSTRAWYNLGITYRTLAQTDAAIEAFEQVAQLDPGDADTLYFLGQLHMQARRYNEAITAFQKCLALDSLHLSAEFGLARAYQLSGNDAEATQHLARFDQLTASKIGKQISLTYGEQGPYSTAEPVGGAEGAPADFNVWFEQKELAGRNSPTQPLPRHRIVSFSWPAAAPASLTSTATAETICYSPPSVERPRPSFIAIAEAARFPMSPQKLESTRRARRTDAPSETTTMTAATTSFSAYRTESSFTTTKVPADSGTPPHQPASVLTACR
jgi:Flp pilus assembly protein TadD